MRPDRSAHRYTLVAIILHWMMALGIAALALIGLAMTHLKLAPMQLFELYQLHKSIGITVFLAAFLRLAWRLTHRPPNLPEAMPSVEKAAATGGHLLLYAFLFALPITGWALVSVSVLNIPTVLYGVLPWPDLPLLSMLDDKAPAEALAKLVHAYGAYVLIGLVAVHAAAALRHHFIIRDDVLKRMLPISRPLPVASPSTKEHSS
ncbi:MULTISPECIES: cytochrome b [Rhizobium]|uniref:Cytochrome b561 n=1 Tax=Rhizobium miluonense TaxID=411945 RepID=A0A1C3W7F8_9HYPH|nr:cytochrome b [Rhizobium miluonense]SCB36127.1 cytochrome b561 [Rhizobium miluonense]